MCDHDYSSLCKSDLNHLFIDALGDAAVWYSKLESFPLECDVSPRPVSRYRVYLYTVTRQYGGRPQDEYKIQVILPGQKPRTKAPLDTSDGRFPLLGGYSPDFGAFVFWDATLYAGFSYSRNMQVRENTLAETLSNKIARLLRQEGGRERERILACQPKNLALCLKQRLMGWSK